MNLKQKTFFRSCKDILLYLLSIKDASFQVCRKDKNTVVKQIVYVE